MKKFAFILLCVVVLPIVVSSWFKGKHATTSELNNAEQQHNANDIESKDAGSEDQDLQLPQDHIAELISNEELIRQIEPVLKKLSNAALNLSIANEETNKIFSIPFQIRDIQSIKAPGSEDARNLNLWGVETGDLLERRRGTSKVWTMLLNRVHYFDNAKFYAVKVSDNKALPESFSTEVGFSALGKTSQNTWLSIAAKGTIDFQSSNDETWLISKWEFNKFVIQESEKRLFEDVSSDVFSSDDYQKTQHSQHYEILVNAIRNGPKSFADKRQKDYFPRGGTTGRHPSVAIVDIDNDGWDDLYVVEQWRNNMLFRNNRDGTFVEVSSEYELDIPGYGTSCVFADFDNDGDPDLFLGRSLRRSIYLENVDGKFVDRSQLMFSFELPFLVTAVSAADYNGDGLLDLYLATYGFPAHPAMKWTREFLNESDRKHMMQLYRSGEYQRFVNAPGPANLLLENRGDRFELSQFNSQVSTWANSFQGSWSDFDDDGDQDLYVANDFARDYLFQNDEEEGFADVTLKVGDETMTGFGMGATWGDYDQDGRMDLYVSNMYSKAGIRITEHFDGLDRRFRRSADGNRLYRNVDGRLKLISANEGPGLNVHKAGWSWGGQFLDVDNDGLLDLYVCSGYFTAPRMFATDLDL